MPRIFKRVLESPTRRNIDPNHREVSLNHFLYHYFLVDSSVVLVAINRRKMF